LSCLLYTGIQIITTVELEWVMLAALPRFQEIFMKMSRFIAKIAGL